jgi:hypothetical protein
MDRFINLEKEKELKEEEEEEKFERREKSFLFDQMISNGCTPFEALEILS